MISYDMEMVGVDEQIRKLVGYDALVDKHLLIATGLGTNKLVGDWKIIAPVDTSRYRGSISGNVSIISGSIIGIASTNVSERGFPYPAALEESAKYHYRRGPRKGQLTQGKVKRVLKMARKTIEGYYKDALKRITQALAV